MYLDWMRGLRDWCISRQLWLGHRIPVYSCPNGHTFASVEEPTACTHCGDARLEQDPDVLDTWFSSALWPFATLGWPDDTADLRTFYPTGLNVTAREIINLWVARMIFSGIAFMGDIPFRHVAINCVVQSKDGQRMSKSKGNVVDPRRLIETHGADALRAWAASVAMSTQDTRFDETRIEGFRRFSNKLWNATRLVLASVDGGDVASPAPGSQGAVEDRWIMHRLQTATQLAKMGIEGYSFQVSVDALYEFVWNEFCDWYLEAVKDRLRSADHMARAVSVHVLDSVFRLLHPFMPFVTEELWHRLPGKRNYLVRVAWPEVVTDFLDQDAEVEFSRLMRVVEEIRAVRKSAGLGDSGGQAALDGMPHEHAALVATLARVEVVPQLAQAAVPLTETAGSLRFPAGADGAARKAAELQRLRSDLERAEAKLSNPEFRSRAPAEVVAKEERKAADLRATIDRLS
jgi:valyl-tRNA synthetase